MIPKLAMVLQIIKRANQNGENISSLCTRFINEFHTDMADLQCLPPTDEPRVTEHIKDHIIKFITEVFSISLTVQNHIQCFAVYDNCILSLTLFTIHLVKLFTLCVCEQIIKNDKGYVVDGNVYFSVDRYPEYLSLSGTTPNDNFDGSRVAVDPRKRNSRDFALWKVS
jgi:cysteinyl-tRNA synthetase